MSEQPRHLRLVESPPISTAHAKPSFPEESRPVAFLHEWRAAKIAVSMAMHPTSLARTQLPALRPVH